jgi:signal transduction histidine kinase
MTDHDLLPAEVAAALGEHDHEVIETGHQIEFEEAVPLADGIHMYLTVKFPLRDAVGSIYAVCGISTDVTELKRAQQELDRREALELSNRATSAFLSRVSHELRTPLNAILGFGQVLEVDALHERQRNSVEQIMKGGRHLLALVNDLLEISRIESGELKVSLSVIDLVRAVDDVVRLVEPLAADRAVSIVHRADPEMQPVLADEQRVRQVLLNLLSNAIKYNRDGGEVEVHVAEEREGRVTVRITDTGEGIAEEDLERLFSPFDRLGAEHTAVEGTGLGLALSKLMVEAMDGLLDVRSAPGVGSTFSIELPVAAPLTGSGQDASDKALAGSGR